MVARLKSRPIGLKFDNCGLQCLVCTRNYFYIRLFLAFSECFQLSQNFQKFWLRNKWTALVWVEIFWSKWFTFRGGPLWPVSPVQQKTCLSISKIRICNPTLLSSHQSFGQNRNGSLQFDWRPCFNWTMSFHFFLIIPLVSIWPVFQNGKHQLCLKSSVQQIPCQDSSWIYHGSVEYCIQSLSLRFARISSTELWLIFLISPGPSSSPQEAGFVEHLEMFSLN